MFREVGVMYALLVGDHLADPGIDGRKILKWIFKKRGDMGWIDLAQDRDRWRALVNAVTDHRVP
jgi:hypothetical protein